MSTKKPTTTAKTTATKPTQAPKTTTKTTTTSKPNKPDAAKMNVASNATASPAQTKESATALVVIDIKSIKIKEISDVMEDQSGLQKKSNKWPLIIDPDNNARTFLRYTDANYINCSDVFAMKPENLRRTLIGGIRYNKPIILDLEDRDIKLWIEVKNSFESIEPGLLESLMDKKLLENEKYLKLVKIDIDGPEYKDYCFTEFDKFKLILLTSNQDLDKPFLNRFTVYKIVL